MIEPSYEFQEVQGVDGNIDYQVGSSLYKRIQNPLVKDAYLPFGLVIVPPTGATSIGGGGGGNSSFSSTIRKKAIHEDCPILPEYLFHQLFENATKPVRPKNKTIRTKTRTKPSY